jgi:hypothetical protein
MAYLFFVGFFQYAAFFGLCFQHNHNILRGARKETLLAV